MGAKIRYVTTPFPTFFVQRGELTIGWNRRVYGGCFSFLGHVFFFIHYIYMHTFDDSWSTYCYYWKQYAMVGLTGSWSDTSSYLWNGWTKPYESLLVSVRLVSGIPVSMCPGKFRISTRGCCEAYLIRGVSSFRGREGDGLILLDSIGVIAKFRMRLLG